MFTKLLKFRKHGQRGQAVIFLPSNPFPQFLGKFQLKMMSNFFKTAHLAACLVLFFSCKNDGKYEPTNLVEETKTATDPILQLLSPAETGVDFKNVIRETYDDNIATNLNKYNGGGVGVADFNGDGLQDLYFVSCDDTNRLYLNLGNLKFRDATLESGLASPDGFETAVTMADVNADGLLDIYICRSGSVVNEARRNRLYINKGVKKDAAGFPIPTFSEESKRYGLDDKSASTGANFFDFDGDGDLDLYLLNHPVNGSLSVAIESKRDEKGNLRPVLEPKTAFDSDRLYRNDGPPTDGGSGAKSNGKGGFTDVSKAAGIWNFGYGLSVSVTDFNRDGWPDVYCGNDFIQPDMLYINQKNGRFENQLGKYFRHTSEHTMGTDLTDFDNDGLVDLLGIDMLGATNYRRKIFQGTLTESQYSSLMANGYFEPVVRNVLQRNNGNNTFSEIGCLAGVFQTDWSWSGLLFDADNDGWKDMHITNGYRREITDRDFLKFTLEDLKSKGKHPRDVFKNLDDFLNLLPTYKPRNFMFKNMGNWQFSDVSGEWQTMPASWSLGSVWADLDNDGDLELVTNNLEDPAFIYKNLSREKNAGNFLQIKLVGDAKNPFAVSASAMIFTGGKTQYLEQNPTHGIFSSVEHLLHFGLGKNEKVEKLVVRWPDGKTQTLTDIAANQRLTLKYSDATGYVSHLAAVPTASFFVEKTDQSGLDWTHVENKFNDFERWQLNPWKTTELGPFAAVGDVNGDGLDDFFVGNSFDSPAALFVQIVGEDANNGKKFQKTNTQLFENEKIYEDHGAVFFDADGDRDADLFVVSGGAEATAPIAWQPRLYLNDGRGNFSKTNGAIPEIREVGGRAAAHDFDGDGDLDLFLGGRVLPNNWPLAPRSFILENDGKGRFSDATAGVSPDFERCGMVTDLIFENVDSDPALELVVCGEWMPVSIFKYSGGKFQNQTKNFGLENTTGLWNRLAAADLDGDGDLDLVAGNLGLNTRFVASEKYPMQVFAKDFDGNGQLDPIVTFAENGKDYPIVQQDLLNKIIPKLKKKFLFAKDYANATVQEIFEKEGLETALKLSAATLETCWFENQNGKFVQRKLPNAAQTAPVQGILVGDFSGDGRADILLAGNKYGFEVETNRCDASNGCFLTGNGTGQFEFLENTSTGFWAMGEARDLVLLRGAGGRRMVLVANNHGKPQVFWMK